MSRYINRGSFGTRGVDRVNLLESKASGVFLCRYWATEKQIVSSLRTTDLSEAKKKIAELMTQKREGKPVVGPERDRVLYVIQRGDDGPIKIGITRRLKQRISQLQNGSAEKLKVLRVYKMSDVERAVHAELERKSRLEGEWFPADLLSSVDRFFNVDFDVIYARAQKQRKAEVTKVLGTGGAFVVDSVI